MDTDKKTFVCLLTNRWTKRSKIRHTPIMTKFSRSFYFIPKPQHFYILSNNNYITRIHKDNFFFFFIFLYRVSPSLKYNPSSEHYQTLLLGVFLGFFSAPVVCDFVCTVKGVMVRKKCVVMRMNCVVFGKLCCGVSVLCLVSCVREELCCV